MKVCLLAENTLSVKVNVGPLTIKYLLTVKFVKGRLMIDSVYFSIGTIKI